ncbi:MAG: DUF2961 domain-containing protein [Fimbriimonas sp.]|nr:DUF2961 domain-containing protein [Fimbriimonas sp.]
MLLSTSRSVSILLATSLIGCAFAQEIDVLPRNHAPRWYSFENPTGAKGAAAATNKSAKGNAWEPIAAGATKELMKFEGCGTIRRMWFTFRPWTPTMLRSVVIEMYWDHATKPAVSVPIGDFFTQGLALPVAFQNQLFSNPEGRSLNCYVPMPFRTGARVVLRNEAKEDVGLLFYDIDVTKEAKQDKDAAYFHAFWKRDPYTKLGQDYELLPQVRGRGRYLGATIGVQGHPQYGDAGWGEGEAKIYLDGDGKLPTISGTGTEDYIGTGWGMGPFSNLYQGCTVSDNVKHCWAFYRLHIPDPICFEKSCRVTIQDIGGDGTENVRKMASAGAELIPVSAAADPGLIRLLDDVTYPKLADPKFPLDAWVNFYRRDDYSSVAYFYLDRPTTDLPALPPVALRTADLRTK